MTIQELKLKSFRAHRDSSVSFAGKVNVVCGPNGVGKTNLLEAVHYLCLSKSFLPGADAYALRSGDPFLEVTGRFGQSGGRSDTVRLAFVPGEGKKMFVNGAPLERLSEVVGRYPVVVLAPGDHAVTSGAPEERRRFVDNILSQAHPLYFADLMAYRRIVRQRNALLRQNRGRPGAGGPQIGSWTEKAIQTGSRIVSRRHTFATTFQSLLDRAYECIHEVAERPTIEYRTLAEDHERSSMDEILSRYRARLERAADREADQGKTLVGPHRDEFVFRLDDLEVRRYASQGQHRTFALALKLAQCFYLEDVHDEQPVFLLDDVLDNLDPGRREAVLSVLMSDMVGQCIITASDDRFFAGSVDLDSAPNSLIRLASNDMSRVLAM